MTDDRQEAAFRRHLAEAARDPDDLRAWHEVRLVFADWLEERGRPEAWAARAAWSARQGSLWWEGQWVQVPGTTDWRAETVWPKALWDSFEWRRSSRRRPVFGRCPDFCYRLIDRPNGRPLLHFPRGTLVLGPYRRDVRPCRGPDAVRVVWLFGTWHRDGELQVQGHGRPPAEVVYSPGLAEDAHPLGLLALFPENHAGPDRGKGEPCVPPTPR
jgi:uncharacterized protein (TIGR02996 family)